MSLSIIEMLICNILKDNRDKINYTKDELDDGSIRISIIVPRNYIYIVERLEMCFKQ